MELTEIYEKYYKKKVPQKTFNTLIKLDPTSIDSKKLGRYCKWILNLWIQGKLLDEDQYKVQEYLEVLQKHRFSKGSGIDVCKCKSLPELYDKLKDLMETKTRSEIESETKITGSEILFKDSRWIVYWLKTWEASKLIGSGTQWCTASRNCSSHFESYNRRGKLIVFINRVSGEKYQYHKNSGIFNSRDYRLGGSRLMTLDETQDVKEIENIVFYNKIIDIDNIDGIKDRITGISLLTSSGNGSYCSVKLDGDTEHYYAPATIQLSGNSSNLCFLEKRSYSDRNYRSLLTIFTKKGEMIGDDLIKLFSGRASYSRLSYENENRLDIFRKEGEHTLYYLNDSGTNLERVDISGSPDLQFGNLCMSLSPDRHLIHVSTGNILKLYKLQDNPKLIRKRIILESFGGCRSEDIIYSPDENKVYTADEVLVTEKNPLRNGKHRATVRFETKDYIGSGMFFLYKNMNEGEYTKSFVLEGGSSKLNRSLRISGDTVYYGKSDKILENYPTGGDCRFILIPETKGCFDKSVSGNYLLISPYGWTIWNCKTKGLITGNVWCKIDPKELLGYVGLIRSQIEKGTIQPGKFDPSTKIEWFDELWSNFTTL